MVIVLIITFNILLKYFAYLLLILWLETFVSLHSDITYETKKTQSSPYSRKVSDTFRWWWSNPARRITPELQEEILPANLDKSAHYPLVFNSIIGYLNGSEFCLLLFFVELTIINSTEAKFRANREKWNFSQGQTSSEVKPGRARLVLEWVTTFKQKLLCWSLSQIFFEPLPFFFTSVKT